MYTEYNTWHFFFYCTMMTYDFLSAPQKEKTTLNRTLMMRPPLLYLLPRPSPSQHFPSYHPGRSSPLTYQSSTPPSLSLVSSLLPPPQLPLPHKPSPLHRLLVRPLRPLLCRSSPLSSLTLPSPTRQSSRLSITACQPITNT